MSRISKNTLFITLNLLAFLALNINMLCCDEIKISTITKNNMLIEVTSEPQFFQAVKDTLDSFNNGIFISFDYIESQEEDEDNEEIEELEEEIDENEIKTKKIGSENFEYYYEDEDFDSDYINKEIDPISKFYEDEETENLLEQEFFEEADLDELENFVTDLKDYDLEGKTAEELNNKLNQVSGLIKKFNNGLEENHLANTEGYENAELSNENEDIIEYFDEDDQNSVLRNYVHSQFEETEIQTMDECARRNIKKLSLWTMFNMETQVKFNLNSVF